MLTAIGNDVNNIYYTCDGVSITNYGCYQAFTDGALDAVGWEKFQWPPPVASDIYNLESYEALEDLSDTLTLWAQLQVDAAG